MVEGAVLGARAGAGGDDLPDFADSKGAPGPGIDSACMSVEKQVQGVRGVSAPKTIGEVTWRVWHRQRFAR